MDAERIEQAAEILYEASAVCVSTGAGMSAESGVPTFRDENGLWSNFKPEELATPEAFAGDPKTVWAWYRWRRGELARIEPHEGHRVLALWEKQVDEFVIVTQNVDGLHHRAGSENVIELHGRLDVVRCTGCAREIVGLDDLGEDPRCSDCAERLRPGVVWFGEMLPPGAIEAAGEAAHGCEVMVVIGTSGVVQPAASLADAAKAGGARVIEINPNPTPISHFADVCVRSGCRDALTAIDKAWRELAC